MATEHLSTTGKKRTYNLGVKLRKRYSKFLGSLYYADLIEAISSSTPRSVISMQSVLAGLFPPSPEWQLKSGLEWQPVYFIAPSINEDKVTQRVKHIYRNGDRTPNCSYLPKANNPHANHSFYPYGIGQLTLDGENTAFNLGVKLNKRYSKFLGKIYYVDLIEAISSSSPRSFMSMQTVLASLFPPNKEWELIPNLNWQPIHFTAPNINNDKLIYPSCKKVNQVKGEMDQEKAAVYKQISSNSGINITSSFDVMRIHKNFHILDKLDYDLPGWVLPIWPQPFTKYAKQYWKEMLDQTVHYAIGSLLKKINTDTMNKIDNTLKPKDRKMFMYSGHDINVIAYLGAIGAYKENLHINFSSCIMIEVHKIEDEYFIKVLFDNSNGKQPEVIKIPACGDVELCPLDNYISITEQKYGPEEWSRCSVIRVSKRMVNCPKNLMYWSVYGVITIVGIITLVVVNEQDDRLEFVAVLFRHGQRTIPYLDTYPNDPHREESYKPFGLGGLTYKGQNEMLDVGRELRKRYKSYLGEIFSHDLVEAISSSYDRSKMSLSLVLATLFPPNAEEVIETGVNWQPVHYTYLQEEDDDMLAFWGKCTDFNQDEIQKFFSSKEIIELNKKYKNVYKYIQMNTGENVTSLLRAAQYYKILEAQTAYGLTLPEWTHHIFPEPLNTIHKLHWRGFIGTTKDIKYAAGRLLQTISGAFSSRINQTLSSERKMHIYSGHDFGISGTLRALQIDHDYTLPEGGYILFELHKINDIYGVKVFYQDYSSEEPKLMTIRNCSPFCEIDRFIQLTEQYYPNPNICQ
ncbi:PREDICTED: uncharacterized protein LOC108565647 [Nicrophorus vespilloides]|uniref:acid phosphatase n=1 Tax=Nicrophorus vespilloides TaxID=110193 RepID=A0ABM1N1J9_NICVS|nr:PREDICTED: uncharacterized protein LOC108565647 [Nicrophorus vespilloides]